MSESNANLLKLTLLGNGGVGKFVEEYQPTKDDAYKKKIMLQGEYVEIDILDTAGQEDYPAVRDSYLRHGDGFIIVFDLTSRETFQSLRKHRENVLRVKSDNPEVPIVIVGNKNDLKSSRRVSFEEASGLAETWNILYIETSAKTKENVEKAFNEILTKIKQIKSQYSNNSDNHKNNPRKTVNPPLTKEEEEAIRNDSKRKRVQKFFQNFKSKCVIS